MFMRSIMSSGLFKSTAQAILGYVTAGLTATGTNKATGLVLSTSVSVFSTVAASTAAVLPPMGEIGDECIVANLGANALLVFPSEAGSNIQTGAADASFSIAAGKTAKFKRVTATQIIALLSA